MTYIVQGASTVAPLYPLNGVSTTQSPLVAGKPHIYVLPTRDRTRLKIGQSIDPLRRIAHLIRLYPEVDLSRSVIVSVDAHLIETILHSVFEPYRLELLEQRDGYSEWFIGDFGEDIVDLCLRIANYRQTEYLIFREVPALLEAHLSQQPVTDVHAAPRTKRKRLQVSTHPCLADLAVFQARQLVEVLKERTFDEILVQNGRYYLVRTVWRNNEPEGWKKKPWNASSDWSARLVRAARVKARIDGIPVGFHFLYPLTCERSNREFCREYYRIAQGPGDSLDSAAHGQDAPLTRAFAILWEALAPLKQRVLPDPEPEPWIGFRLRQRQQKRK